MTVIDELRHLAEGEIAPVLAILDKMDGRQIAGLLMEAIRAVNELEVYAHLTPDHVEKPEATAYDILIRGWNLLLGHLMRRMAILSGIPGIASTDDTQGHILAMLHSCGRSHILAHAADMAQFGVVEGVRTTDGITLRLSDRMRLDYFSAEANEIKFADRMSEFRGDANRAPSLSRSDVRDRIAGLVFPWSLGGETLVGYTADPELDALFIDVVTDMVSRWRDAAGVHSSADLDGCTGEELADVVALIISFHLKHIVFVDVAAKRFAINYTMALTIWNQGDELAQPLADLMSVPVSVTRRALELISVTPDEWPHYLLEGSPQIPLLLEISPGYRVRLPAAIFRNPFTGIRMRHERRHKSGVEAFRVHREGWMATDLYNLFQGNRYQRLEGPVILRRHKRIVTDIDAAVLDVTTGELALFQLKWQDFHTSAIRSQVSKARNYTREVDLWAQRVGSWIEEFGGETLCRNLRFQVPHGFAPTSIHLFAIGRAKARFQSFGVVPDSPSVASSTWPEFVNSRFEVGPSLAVLSSLHRAMQVSAKSDITRTPRPHEMICSGRVISFLDIWNSIGEASDAPGDTEGSGESS